MLEHKPNPYPIDPHKPTDALPRSKEKLLVMQARLAVGLPLSHPEDKGADKPDGDLDEAVPRIEPNNDREVDSIKPEHHLWLGEKPAKRLGE